MQEKIFSFLRRVKEALTHCVKSFSPYKDKIGQKLGIIWREKAGLPSAFETRYILRSFSFKEKVTFLFFLLSLFASSMALLWKLDRSLAIEIPKKGGSIEEGIIGTPRFVNPLLAISDADRDLTNLIYSGLMRTDGKGGLMPDLAERYEISDDGLVYTFVLKDGLDWPDRKPITSDDVIFTIQMAKNQILKSNQRAGWEGVETEKVDDHTIRFFLKKPYAPFLENATLGILPKHIWGEISPEQMTLTDFNIKPIGSGPYEVVKIVKDSTGIIQSYVLEPNKKFALGTPFIKDIILKFYPSEKKLIAAYENGEIDAVGGISPQNAVNIKRSGTELKTLLLPRVFAVFFNQNNAPLFANKEVRQALDLATDKEKIVQEVLQNFGSILKYPLPPGAIGAIEPEEEINKNSADENLEKAKSLLKNSGWKLNEQEKIMEKKISKKETLKLELSLATSNAPELAQTAELLKTMWEKLGAKVDLKIFEIGDLNQNIIRPRKYDALLFGMVMSRDPDPFAFWHSSQRNDPGLNIALYTNIAADKLLEDARSISGSEKRKEKYESFQKQVEKDAPAVFLYSPKYIYILPSELKGLNTDTITIPSERFTQVQKWYTETEKIWSR